MPSWLLLVSKNITEAMMQLNTTYGPGITRDVACREESSTNVLVFTLKAEIEETLLMLPQNLLRFL